MALHYTLDKIKDYQAVCWTPDGEDKDGEEVFRINGKTEALIFGTMSVGIGKITEKKLAEFWTRWTMSAKLGFLSERITLDDIRRHIGLSTNASPLSKTKFLSKLYSNMEWGIKRDIKKALKEELAEAERAKKPELAMQILPSQYTDG